MTQAAKTQEPSMEEILASIRRIIADDDTKADTKPAAAAPTAPPTPPLREAPASPPPAAPPRTDPTKATKQDGIDVLLEDTVRVEPTTIASEAPDVLDLTESMVAPAPAASAKSFRTIDGEPDVVFADAEPTPPPRPARVSAESPPRPIPRPGPERPLLSSTTAAAVDSAFNTLAQTVLVQNGRTLEDLVREMLRPMLKSWLDDNLPGIVERLVKSEIDRVSRGRN